MVKIEVLKNNALKTCFVIE